MAVYRAKPLLHSEKILMKRTLPTFIIGGAPRCATTWVHKALSAHPDVFLASPVFPEPKFFLVDDLYELGLDRYRQFFEGNQGERAIGEKSTNYLESPVVPARIHKHLPEVKLVFILRDPVTRAYNNYLWSKTNGIETEDFATALKLEEEREATVEPRLRYARPHAYVSRGFYADLLGNYFKLFPKQQVLCLKYESLAEDQISFLTRLHEFLGVEKRPEDAQLEVINRAQGEQSETLDLALRDRLQRLYAEPNTRLTTLIGEQFTWGYES